jgi:hypothetical protein
MYVLWRVHVHDDWLIKNLEYICIFITVLVCYSWFIYMIMGLVLLFLFLYWYWKNNIWQFVDARCTIFVHDVLHLEKWTRPFRKQLLLQSAHSLSVILVTSERLLYRIFNSKTNNNNKTRTVWVSYWWQVNGCFTVFSIAKHNIWQFVDARCTIFVHDVLHLEKWTRPFRKQLLLQSAHDHVNKPGVTDQQNKTITRQEQFECHIGDKWTVALPYFQ